VFVKVLVVVVESVIRRLPNSLCPTRNNSWQDRWYKWSLLKVREGKYKKEPGGHSWNLQAERACFSSPVAFKTCANLWERYN
jgi:hypothetical protein